MITYEALQADRRQFLALTGLTLSEFQRLLTAFPQAYQQHYPANQTAEGQPRQRSVGGGCKGRLEQPEDKLLFLLVYLKTYPLQAVMGELFDLSTPQVNYWIHRLLPVLRSALEDLGVLPERDPTHFAQDPCAAGKAPRLMRACSIRDVTYTNTEVCAAQDQSSVMRVSSDAPSVGSC